MLKLMGKKIFIILRSNVVYLNQCPLKLFALIIFFAKRQLYRGLITSANNLDPDQDGQNVCPVLVPHRLTL